MSGLWRRWVAESPRTVQENQEMMTALQVSCGIPGPPGALARLVVLSWCRWLCIAEALVLYFLPLADRPETASKASSGSAKIADYVPSLMAARVITYLQCRPVFQLFLFPVLAAI